ncbi:MAG: hypothetical protein RSB99_01750 [Bacilli bacterium]
MKDSLGRYNAKEIVLILVMGIGIGILVFSGFFLKNYKNGAQGISKKESSLPLVTEEPVVTREPVVSKEPVIEHKEDTSTQMPAPTVTPDSRFTSEDEVVNYFNNYEQIVSNSRNTDDKGLLDTVKTGFITMMDFLFYDTEIGGYRFKELTAKAKLQVIKIALTVDNTIDKYLPDYKNTIKSGYTKITEKLVKTYLEITSLLCEKVGDETCNYAKEDFKTMKKSFGFTFGLIKEAGGNVKEAIKTWYQIFSGKE